MNPAGSRKFSPGHSGLTVQPPALGGWTCPGDLILISFIRFIQSQYLETKSHDFLTAHLPVLWTG